MFDTYTKSPSEYIPYEKTIIHKRAPTDESIELYEEMKEKAYNSILDSIKVDGNILNFSAIVYKDPNSFHTICKYKVVLNGYNIIGEIKVDETEFRLLRKEEIQKKIFEDVSKYITFELLKQYSEEIIS